jgi:hypothetical protein
MACVIVFVQPLAMATTQFARGIRDDIAPVCQLANAGQCNAPRMRWVVAVGSDGVQRLQMQWTASDNRLDRPLRSGR